MMPWLVLSVWTVRVVLLGLNLILVIVVFLVVVLL